MSYLAVSEVKDDSELSAILKRWKKNGHVRALMKRRRVVAANYYCWWKVWMPNLPLLVVQDAEAPWSGLAAAPCRRA
jgi:hypothetical protein